MGTDGLPLVSREALIEAAVFDVTLAVVIGNVAALAPFGTTIDVGTAAAALLLKR